MAFLPKATVSAFLVFFLAVLAALRWRDLPALIRNPYYLWTAALITLICGGYYMYALYSFGKLFPTPAALYPKNPPANPDGLWDYGLYYVEVMWHRLDRKSTRLKSSHKCAARMPYSARKTN